MNKFLVTTFFLLSQNCFGSGFAQDLVTAAIDRIKHDVTYDGSYFSIAYPNGDVPENIGVCTDVIIRSYRALGADLQVLVHEDMSRDFDAYPSKRIWGLNTTDRNIDHRRVPNLQVFLSRHGKVLPVTDKISETSGNPLIVHNIGSGPSLDDMLFTYEITGHYHYAPENISY